LKHVFGFRSDVNDGIHFVDESSALFAAGHHIVIHNLDNQEQIFCECMNHGPDLPQQGICALDVSASKKYCAVAEKSEHGPVISIIVCTTEKMRVKRKLENMEVQSRDVISVRFSPGDEKHLLVLCGEPDWVLLCFHWEKQKLVHRLKHVNRTSDVLTSASFCPMEPNLVVVTGNSQIRFFKTDGAEFRLQQTNLSKKDNNDYTCHSWDNEKRLLVGTYSGEILVFEGHEFKGAFEIGANVSPISSIVCTAKGFACGCENGVLLCFEKGGDEKELYHLVKKISFQNEVSNSGNSSQIEHLAISPTEENLIVTLHDNQLFLINLANLEIVDVNSLQPLFAPVHRNTVYSLDVCVRKPFLVTCGADRFIRIYNFAENVLVLQKRYKQEPLSVSMHPTGFHIVVGFNDKVRLLNILLDDIRESREFPIKGCRCVKFSNGGQCFAAVNGATVQIYHTYTCQMLVNLRGHQSKVTSVFWSEDDTYLTTTSSDNTVFEWEIKTATRRSDHPCKGCIYFNAVTHDKKIFCVGSDACLKIVSSEENKVLETLPFDVVLTHLELNSRASSTPATLLFGGTRAGFLKLFSLPLKSDNELELSRVWNAHSEAVTDLVCSDDGNLLFSASEDGSVCIFEAKDGGVRKKEANIDSAEEVLVRKIDLHVKLEQLKELKKSVEGLKIESDHLLEKRKLEHESKLYEAASQFQTRLSVEEEKYSTLLKQKRQTKMNYEIKLGQLVLNQDNSNQELNVYYEKKILNEVRRYDELSNEMKDLKEKWKNDSKLRDETYENEVELLEDEYNSNTELEENKRDDIREKHKELKLEFDEVLNVVTKDSNDEIKQIEMEFNDVLASEKSTTLDLKGNNGFLKREFAALKQKIQSGSDKLLKSNEQLYKLDEETRRLEKDLEGYAREIKERASTIKEKERMIIDLRKKNQELEKFKFVLEYKINELNRQIKPREDSIVKSENQIEEMNAELTEYANQNELLELQLKDAELKLKASIEEEKGQIRVIRKIQNKKKLYKEALKNVLKSLSKPMLLKKQVKTLYQKYGNLQELNPFEKENSTSDAIETYNPTEEFQRRRNFYKRTESNANKKMLTAQQRHDQKMNRYLCENTILLKEINDLRVEIEEFEAAQ